METQRVTVTRKLFLVTLFLFLLVTVGCRNASAQSASVSALLINGGRTPLALAVSLPVATVKTGEDAQLTLWLDTFLVESGWGGGASVPVNDVLGSLRLTPAAGLGLLDRFRVGAALLKTGSGFDTGPYLLVSVVETRF